MSLLTNLLAFYKLDNTNDDSGGGFNLTNTGSATFSAGLIGNAVDFGSLNLTKSLSTSSQMGLSSTADRTISCWVKVNGSQFSTATNNTYVSFGYTNIIYDITADSATTVMMGSLRPGVGNDEYRATYTLSTSTWSHFVITNSGSSGTAYINGSQVGTWTVNTGGGSGGGGFSIGNLRFSTDIWFASALVDAVGVWGRALSGTEVTQLYNGGAGLEYPFTTDTGFATTNLVVSVM